MTVAFSFCKHDRPLVMGILNITPDSFSDGGRYLDPAAAVARALDMEREGADLLDLGAQSTRPGAVPIPPEEEWARLAPVLATLRGRVHVPLSVDTFEPFVAEQALAAGAVILNDVSGSLANGFPALAKQYDAGLIMMAQNAHTLADVTAYFDTAKATARAAGLSEEQVCLDMGIGFHADRALDLTLIRHTDTLVKAASPYPLLCGASRKRVIAYAAGDSDVTDRLGGSLALHTAAMLGGARVIRAHDIKDTAQAARVARALCEITR